MIILGIETSCDETAAAVVEKIGNRVNIVSNIVASSAKLHQKFGGIVPEQAAREQLKTIIPVIQEAIGNSQLTIRNIDAIAVTQGPGLIGSLLVGVETAKTLSLAWNKPLIPVNHLLAHFYACWVTPNQTPPSFPFLGLLVSGGHTDLLLFKNHNNYKYLGGTRDDAAGECFDKCARLLGLSYPGGPNLSKLAEHGNPNSFKLPKPMANSNTYDFSFSGLKTAVASLLPSKNQQHDFAASVEEAIAEHLIRKTLQAAKDLNLKQIVVAGGVASNKRLRSKFPLSAKLYSLNANIIFPPPNLCTDNAVTTGVRALYEKPEDPLKIQANPGLSLRENGP